MKGIGHSRMLSREIWQDLRRPENILTGAAIVLFVVVEVLSLLNVVAIDTVMQAILGILGLVAAGTLLERVVYLGRLEALTRESLELIRAQTGRPSSDLFLLRRDQRVPLEELLESAEEVYAAGQTLAELIGLFKPFWLRKLNQGLKLKVLIPRPTDQACQFIPQLIGDIRDPSVARRYIELTLANLGTLMEDIEDNGSIEVRLVSYAPTVSFIVIDGDQDRGKMQIELIFHRCPMRERPHMMLTRTRDRYWYEVFHERFKAMWRDGEPWSSE